MRVKHLPDLFPHQVIYRLHIQLGRQPFLYAVDYLEFGRALLGLLEQALNLREQPHVLDGNGRLIGKYPEQVRLFVGEWVDLLPANKDRTDRLAFAHQRCRQQRSLHADRTGFPA